ncbi:MAG: phosphatase family protein [Mucilaginibacter sp.]|nr:phosphatase family protein [Mucilaginibacter sp.]
MKTTKVLANYNHFETAKTWKRKLPLLCLSGLRFASTRWMLLAVISLLIISGCKKDAIIKDEKVQTNNLSSANANSLNGHLKQTKTYSSEVAFKWIDMQLRLFRTNATPIGGLPPARYVAYSAIALYESVVPGMPSYQTLSGQLTSMPAMPQTDRGFAYHWPTCGNAALAAITRDFFPTTSAANKTAIDSLENALNTAYQGEVGNDEFQRSAQFGKSIAQLVFDWSKTDGASIANAPYTPPVGPGLWVATPPAFAAPFGPYWGNNRLFVQGSLDGSAPPPPPTYSTDPSSDFYQMAKDVYDVSQTLTPAQIATGLYYRDNPGYGGGHYLSILRGILQQEQPQLDFTAMAFAQASIGIVDAGIGCWQTKYQYNIERPITYIQGVLGHTTWTPLFATPNFPEYTSGHCTIAGVFSKILTGLLGANYHFTDHSYDYLGMAPRSFNSFTEFELDVSDARVFAGIHYRNSCVQAVKQGEVIGQNVINKLQFKK